MRRFGYAALAVALVGGLGRAGDGSTVDFDGLKSKTPAGWKKGAPDNKFRAYQFSLPKAEGDKEDAELVVFYFGKGSGGSTADNLKRWKGMFTGADGRPVDDDAKVAEFKVGTVPVTFLDVAGTYSFKNPPFSPTAKVERRENYRLLGVVFESPDGPYFIRVTGPARTVEANKAGFDRWLKTFQ